MKFLNRGIFHSGIQIRFSKSLYTLDHPGNRFGETVADSICNQKCNSQYHNKAHKNDKKSGLQNRKNIPIPY